MTHDPSIRHDVGRAALPPAAPRANPTARDTVAFEALLQRLVDRVQHLNRDGETLSAPEELAGAVDRARASIDDALSLSDQLLEAYRAERQRGRDRK